MLRVSRPMAVLPLRSLLSSSTPRSLLRLRFAHRMIPMWRQCARRMKALWMATEMATWMAAEMTTGGRAAVTLNLRQATLSSLSVPSRGGRAGQSARTPEQGWLENSPGHGRSGQLTPWLLLTQVALAAAAKVAVKQAGAGASSLGLAVALLVAVCRARMGMGEIRTPHPTKQR